MSKKIEVICDKCDSEFILKFDVNDVASEPTCCPFCGDTFKVETDELDFSKDNYDDDDLNFDDEDE